MAQKQLPHFVACRGEIEGMDGTGENGDNREIAVVLASFPLFPSVQKYPVTSFPESRS
jgi:hypothetical protein